MIKKITNNDMKVKKENKIDTHFTNTHTHIYTSILNKQPTNYVEYYELTFKHFMEEFFNSQQLVNNIMHKISAFEKYHNKRKIV